MSNEPSIEPPYGVQETARTWDKEIAELANRQHGVVGRRQLPEMGIGRRSLAGRLDRGSLHELHRGVYAVGHTVISLRGRWMAAVLAAGPDAVLSHRAAGCLWGMIGSGSGPIDVTRPGGPRARRPGISGHESTVADDESGTSSGSR